MADTTRLEDILVIENKDDRQKELVDYAFSLKINVKRAMTESGSLNEDELTVLIYDALETRKRGSDQVLALAVVSIIIVLMLGGVMFLFGNFMAPALQRTIVAE